MNDAAINPTGSVVVVTPASAAAGLSYVLITAARNEESLIEATIKSVVNQTIRPLRWIIVSDGSTDRTDQIVQQYINSHDWIELLRMPERADRQFAAKAHCFNAGYELARKLPHDVVGNLDADITFERDYIEYLLNQFAQDDKLGVVGTPFVEDHEQPDRHTYAHRFAQMDHVSGACQLFRRSCFEEVGGYQPIKGGAIDWIAVTTARMRGWKTRTFTDKVCFHHRKLGTGNDNSLMVRFRYGEKAYYVGGHPVWILFRAIFQMRQRPQIVGGLLFGLGYLTAILRRRPKLVPQDLIAFHRSEQLQRLSSLFFRKRKQRI